MKATNIFSLSAHAIARLAERSTLNASTLITLLNAGAYKRVFVKKRPSHSISERNALCIDFGLTSDDLKKFEVVDYEPLFDHLLVWSETDSKPLTIIATSKTGVVVTILNAEFSEGHDWSDRVTPKAIGIARQRAETFSTSQLEISKYEILIRWLDAQGAPRRKILNAKSLLGTFSIPEKRSLIEDRARKLAAGGYDITATIRYKSAQEKIVEEFSIESPI